MRVALRRKRSRSRRSRLLQAVRRQDRRGAAREQSGEDADWEAFARRRHDKWRAAFRSLFMLLQQGRCPFFYYVAQQHTILFIKEGAVVSAGDDTNDDDGEGGGGVPHMRMATMMWALHCGVAEPPWANKVVNAAAGIWCGWHQRY